MVSKLRNVHKEKDATDHEDIVERAGIEERKRTLLEHDIRDYEWQDHNCSQSNSRVK